MSISQPDAGEPESSESEIGERFSDARDLDLASLKALAHPLRVQIFDALSIYGSFTASGLAERLNESSGATSYHLRQLEKHGFVKEVEGKGTGRERWWERTPGAVNIGSDDATDTPAGRSAAELIFRQLRTGEEKLLGDFVERSHDELTAEWRAAADISTMNTRLTADQLHEYVDAVLKLTEQYVLPFKNQQAPGARPVHINFNAFPVMDGDATTRDAEEENA
ncbi:MAG TPA: helix-turn-helix domain-containing protein [Galbitalea sp.]|jgi:DNA-binding transcriptional ArsR family regulator